MASRRATGDGESSPSTHATHAPLQHLRLDHVEADALAVQRLPVHLWSMVCGGGTAGRPKSVSE